MSGWIEGNIMPTDLTIILDNRPGTIAGAAEAIAGAGINVQGTCGFPAEGLGVMHVLVDDGDADTARSAAADAGYEVRAEREVIVTDVEDRPGALAEVARRVADAGINVDLLYLATGTRLVLGPDDLDAARRAL